MKLEKTQLPDKYKKEVSKILGGISSSVSENVTKNVKSTINSIKEKLDIDKKKYDNVDKAIKSLEANIQNIKEQIEDYSKETDELKKILTAFKDDTSVAIKKVVSSVVSEIPQNVSELKVVIENLISENASTRGSLNGLEKKVDNLKSDFQLEEHFTQIEQKQELLLKRCNITFIILGIIIVIDILINVFI